MIQNSSGPVCASSSSDPTAVSIRCEATIELGRKLVKELGLDQSVDTLGRWMAHYIAELIQDAEKSRAEDRPETMRSCCDAILNLWKHRRSFPDDKRPFEELEPLVRTLASLDPEAKTPKYFYSVRTVANDAEENEETKSWLKLIDDVDNSAKSLIRYFLSRAAKESLNKSVEWVKLANAVDDEEIQEFPLIQFLSAEGCVLNPSDPSGEEISRMEDRIKQLQTFTERAQALILVLRKEVKAAQRVMKAKSSKKKRRKLGPQ